MTPVKKILVVEDEAAQVLLLKAHLKHRGFEVIYAMSGEEGLVRAREEKPDLILLDIILPGMSGIDVCLALKDNPKTKSIPIVLLTASQMRDLESRREMLGIEGCLIKPYGISELLEKIEALLPT